MAQKDYQAELDALNAKIDAAQKKEMARKKKIKEQEADRKQKIAEREAERKKKIKEQEAEQKQKYNEQIKRMEAQKKQAEKAIAEQERKERTRRLIIVGATAESEMGEAYPAPKEPEDYPENQKYLTNLRAYIRTGKGAARSTMAASDCDMDPEYNRLIRVAQIVEQSACRIDDLDAFEAYCNQYAAAICKTQK